MLSGRNLRQDVGAFKVLEACGDVTIQHPVGGCIKFTLHERTDRMTVMWLHTVFPMLQVLMIARSCRQDETVEKLSQIQCSAGIVGHAESRPPNRNTRI